MRSTHHQYQPAPGRMTQILRESAVVARAITRHQWEPHFKAGPRKPTR